ncbi:MAG TPA: dihydrolipoamide acetyltransferase family protein [Pseudonocardiaceae bacterium]
MTVEDQVFRLPDLGEGLTEAEVVSWRVAEGDTVHIDQVVVEVETAKALVEVPIPYAGTVLRLHAQAGTSLAVGEPLISVGDSGSGNVLIGYGTGPAPASRRRSRATRPAPSAPTSPSGAPLVISPLVRKLAKDNDIDVARLTPTGSHGVLLRRDVEQALTPADVTRIPLTGLRRTVAEKLTRSRTEIPDATTWVDVDATALMAAKADMQRPERKISLLALLARFCVAGLRRFPALNSTVDTARAEIVQHHHVHLGFAAQTDRGLMVPVVHDADRMTTAELSAELARLTDLARTGSLPPASLTGGTFTLNNYGVFGVDGSTPIINHPEAALLGVGRIIDKPWAVNGELAVRKVTQLSLTFDHRVCDGGVAGGFLRFVADCVERPIVLLGEV